MEILNSNINDLDLIFSFYEEATLFQKTKFHKNWQSFDWEMVKKEILEKKQYKIISEGKVAAIFAVAYSDPKIWKEKDLEPSLYLHRIVSHSDFKGKFLVKEIINWSIQQAKNLNLKYIRLDTFSGNTNLIEYYIKCGFNLVGVTTMEKSKDLPSHYAGTSLALLEIKISNE